MRRRVSGVVVLLALLASAALASGATAKTRVFLTPGSGKPTTMFVVRFRAPGPTGNFGTVRSHYELYASGPSGTGCVSNFSIALRATTRHARVRIALDPERLGGDWCTGTFRGRLAEIQTIICGPHLVCPDILIAPQTIARFSFRVSPVKAGPGATTTGPTFAGLQSAAICLPPPLAVVPQDRTYTLRATAAAPRD